MQKVISAALLVGGLLLLYFGYQESQSVAGEVEELVTGSPGENSMWMIIGGAVAAIAGFVGLLKDNLFK